MMSYSLAIFLPKRLGLEQRNQTGPCVEPVRTILLLLDTAEARHSTSKETLAFSFRGV